MVFSASLSYRSLWTPERISTALWLDAADSSTITTVSGAVSQWNDKSGNGRNASQGTASARPALTTNALNGFNVATFDGSDDCLNINSSFMGTNTLLIVCVVKENNGGFGGVITSKDNAALGFEDASPALNINSARLFEYDPGQGPVVSLATSTTNGSSWGIVAGQSLSSSSYLIAINGTVESSRSNAFTISNTASITTIGKYRTNDTNFGAFDLGELVVLTSNSTQETRQRIEGYLAHKWGLTANLPSNHPFKNSPPRGI